MRSRPPLRALALSLALAVSASAVTPAPTVWTADYAKGPWEQVMFRDASGASHDLWFNMQDAGKPMTAEERQASRAPAGWNWMGLKDAGAAPLYEFAKKTGGTPAYDSKVTPYRLDLSGQNKIVKNVMQGDAQAGVAFMQMASAGSNAFTVNAPPSAPAPAAIPPAAPEPGAGAVISATSTSVRIFTAAAAANLSGHEHGWLTVAQRKEYDAAIKAKGADLAKIVASYRVFIGQNLRKKSQREYLGYVKGGQFDKIEPFIAGVPHYSGKEISLDDGERNILAGVPQRGAYRTAGAAYDAEIQAAMKGVKEPSAAHIELHQVVLKYRPLARKKSDRTRPDPNAEAGQLSDDDFAKIPSASDRNALRAAYSAEWAAAGTDEKRRAVNDAYLKKIDKAVATIPDERNPPRPPLPVPGYDFKNTTTLDQFKALPSDSDRAALCGMIGGNPTGGLDRCGDILANADTALSNCNTPPGTPKTAETIRAQAACVGRVNACQASAKAAPASAPAPAGDRPTSAILSACRAFALNRGNGPTGDEYVGSRANSINDNPCSSPAANPGSHAGTDKDCSNHKDDDKGLDKQFWTNAGSGISFGIGGLILASFFGGPVLMLGVAAASAVAGYYISKSITEPPPDKPSKK